METTAKFPAGTAMVVYVDADGTIIEAVEPDGALPQFAAEGMTDLAGTRFATAGEAAVTASTAIPATIPSQASQEGTSTQSLSVRASVPCCWCKVGGKWYCRPECC